MTTIDLNADLGEGMDSDEAMMRQITSASIACGGHAGDPASMRRAVELALANGVCIGAHPSYADKANFGRVRLDLPSHELSRQIGRQVAALIDAAERAGAEVKHFKLHGALANLAASDRATADVVFRAVARLWPKLIVLAIEGSRQVEAAEAEGLKVVIEAYADRAYLADGTLVARTEAGAVLTEEAAVVRQAVRIAREGSIVAADGTEIATAARSICLHGDTPGAARLAGAVRRALQRAGLEIVAFA
ncbi:MAG: 5-oxoprolinase subunit PxpA [Cucumibacter sp.]